MALLVDLVYLLAILVLSPWLIYKAVSTGKYRRGMLRKVLGTAFLRRGSSPCAWFHGVSVGEILLLRQVVAHFRRSHPDWDCVISTTTDTGFDEARKRFPDLAVFYWPLDFSWAVRRALKRVRPQLVILAEGELWPNFLAAARQQGVSVAMINGRMSPRSFRRYRRLGLLTPHLLKHIDLLAVQTEEYARCFRALGADPERVHVTGSVKYDGVESNRLNPRTQELRRLLGVQNDDLIWIAGSTQAPEEEIVLGIYRRAKAHCPQLRLVLVPRQKERFAEVATLLQRSGESFLRRSALTEAVNDRSVIVLMDTIGELSALWGLADLAYVGGSLDGHRGGQNMIEPAAYGAAVLFGPHVWNFRDTTNRLLHAEAAVQVANGADLEKAVQMLMHNQLERERLGKAAQEFVRSQLGATQRTINFLGCLPVFASSQERAA